MIVSTFELLFARIAPPPPGAAGAVARRIVQGYFLTIANLENRPVSLSMSLTMANAAGNRVINASNVNVIGDTGVTNNVTMTFGTTSTPNPAGRTTATTPRPAPGPVAPPNQPFILAARHTGLIAVLPNFAGLPAADLEIRGTVEIRQNRLVALQGVPEARVLLTPEIRGTFLDNDYPAFVPSPNNAELDFDQIAHALPLAGGRSEVTLPALGGIVFPSPVVNLVEFRSQNPELSEDEARAAVEFIQSMGSKVPA